MGLLGLSTAGHWGEEVVLEYTLPLTGTIETTELTGTVEVIELTGIVEC
jgi:hypothetical protein